MDRRTTTFTQQKQQSSRTVRVLSSKRRELSRLRQHPALDGPMIPIRLGRSNQHRRLTKKRDQLSSVPLSRTWDDLIAAQRVDPEIAPVYQWLEESFERPAWDAVSLKSSGTKAQWNMWPRLAFQGNVLRRRFESAEGNDETWQIVLPKVYRKEFMEITHGGITGGHLGVLKTASGIQARAYWLTWRSDLTSFMRTCEPCARYHRGVVRHQAPMQTPLVGES